MAALDEALRDEVGVAAVRSRRVCVVPDRKAKVPFGTCTRGFRGVLAWAQQFDNGKGQVGKRHGVCSTGGGQELLESLGVWLFGQVVLVFCGDLDDAVPAPGGVDDAANGRVPARCEEAYSGAVCRNHEVLDEFGCPVLLLDLQSRDGFTVEQRARLDGLEAQCSHGMAAALQALRDPVLQHEVLGQSGDGRHAFRHQGVALEPCSDTAVGQLGMVAHHGGVQVGMMDQTLFADDHVDNSGKPVLIGG